MVILLLLGVAFLYLSGGVLLQVFLGEAGLAAAQILFLFLPAVLFVWWGGYDPVASLSLRRPEKRQLWGGLLVLAGGMPVAWFLAWAQSFVIPVPVEMLEAMGAWLVTDNPWRMLWLLILVAAIPAVTEEFLFRGPLLAGLGSRLPPWSAVLGSGLLFGVFHLSPQTAFRFLPTAWLGILLAWVVYETRSIWVGVFLHFINNGSILVLSFLPMTREMASDVDQEPPFALLPVALVLLGVGILTLRRRSSES
jgi:membrane protease YdiL (CAAX protease family)